MSNESESTSSGGFFGKTPGSIAANIGCLVIVVGVIALVMLPGNRGYENRARQSEVKMNLKAIYTASKAWFQEKDHYPAHGGELYWVPEPGNRYTYFVASGGRILKLDERAKAFEKGAAPFGTIAADTQKHEEAPTFETYGDTACPLTRAKHKDGTPASLGLSVKDGEEIYTAAAAGNVDRDDTLDCWSVSTAERVAADGSKVWPGEPFAELNDVEK